MENIIQKAATTHILSKNEIVKILYNDEINSFLFNSADNVRKKFVGDAIHLRGLIEFSNICSQSCLYCGIRRGNKSIERYRMEKEQILALAEKAMDLGIKTLVLQSGEDDFYTIDLMEDLICEIAKLGLVVTLSVGEKSFEEYKKYKEAGASRYLLRIETSDKNLYRKMHPFMDFQNRLNCLENIRQLNYEVGTGCLVGLPEQTMESLADDILFFKKIDADMIGIGPFIPNCDTPLKNAKGGDFYLALKVMALTRLLIPDANIPATTAMETAYSGGRMLALCSGANVVMPNLTDEILRQKYCLYPGKSGINVSTSQNLDELKEKMEKSGRFISSEFGFRKNIFPH